MMTQLVTIMKDYIFMNYVDAVPMSISKNGKHPFMSNLIIGL